VILISGIGVYLLWNFFFRNYNYNLEVAFPNLTFNSPVGLYDSGDGTNRLFVVEQGGKIWVFNNNINENERILYLDISDLISTGGERGLLGFAFHPNYGINGFFYVYYTKTGSGDSKISRFKVNMTDSNLANKSSELKILEVPQPFGNHNGGQLSFGQDGYLYIALGDGGGSGDPSGHGQDRTTLLGAILRIDIDSGTPYTIPMDNPFYNNINGYKEEIFAFGFRNPWRFSFDPTTGNLWAGDVGQNSWEEIDIVESGRNYGWNSKEGNHNFNPGSNVTEIEPPVHEYSSLGVENAITGGFVYRGAELTGLYGNYIYADYGSGKIWALDYKNGMVVKNTLLIDSNLVIPSFGVDSNNELYICAFDGNIYKLNQI